MIGCYGKVGSHGSWSVQSKGEESQFTLLEAKNKREK